MDHQSSKNHCTSKVNVIPMIFWCEIQTVQQKTHDAHVSRAINCFFWLFFPYQSSKFKGKCSGFFTLIFFVSCCEIYFYLFTYKIFREIKCSTIFCSCFSFQRHVSSSSEGGVFVLFYRSAIQHFHPCSNFFRAERGLTSRSSGLRSIRKSKCAKKKHIQPPTTNHHPTNHQQILHDYPCGIDQICVFFF